jgi:hypothetical protein
MIMSYALTLGRVGVVDVGTSWREEACSCEDAEHWCTPAFVFSVPGQVRFRAALDHLISCNKQSCRSLKAQVFLGMSAKLRWLMEEECLLGCLTVQPVLYGSRRPALKRSHFPTIARHLSRCPRESCAQLRRALLLTVRDELRS